MFAYFGIQFSCVESMVSTWYQMSRIVCNDSVLKQASLPSRGTSSQSTSSIFRISQNFFLTLSYVSKLSINSRFKIYFILNLIILHKRSHHIHHQSSCLLYLLQFPLYARVIHVWNMLPILFGWTYSGSLEEYVWSVSHVRSLIWLCTNLVQSHINECTCMWPKRYKKHKLCQ